MFAYSRNTRITFTISIHLYTHISTVPTGWIFSKFDIGNFHENLLRNLEFGQNPTRILGTLCGELKVYLIIAGNIKSP